MIPDEYVGKFMESNGLYEMKDSRFVYKHREKVIVEPMLPMFQPIYNLNQTTWLFLSKYRSVNSLRRIHDYYLLGYPDSTIARKHNVCPSNISADRKRIRSLLTSMNLWPLAWDHKQWRELRGKVYDTGVSD